MPHEWALCQRPVERAGGDGKHEELRNDLSDPDLGLEESEKRRLPQNWYRSTFASHRTHPATGRRAAPTMQREGTRQLGSRAFEG